ncbi:hypothetical protein EJ04DRAFT_509478 [Polyplosphaeria fusca]|uniref:Uncharacterized protein n=1 Tax=Polyplosphaeria fusca TaxID=682080 RepID=A0A9P4V6K6_9PLEO|nr:hypothetical protein EJ04DRAFT_509478 [Polyplosphaeria fusca]
MQTCGVLLFAGGMSMHFWCVLENLPLRAAYMRNGLYLLAHVLHTRAPLRFSTHGIQQHMAMVNWLVAACETDQTVAFSSGNQLTQHVEC